MIEKIKSHDRYAQKILNIEKCEDKHGVTYLKFGLNYMNSPEFSIAHIIIDLKAEIRDIKINDLLNSTSLDFDVEKIIYTDIQLDRLRELRGEKVKKLNYTNELHNFKKEYADSFKVGDHVYFNNSCGIITFKHRSSNSTAYAKNKISLWSVKVNDTEFRYVEGTRLSKRKINDLSNIPIDKELNKLSTEKLLKMYKKGRVRGIGDKKIKRILNEREHIQKGETKIVNLVH